jgi:hypothetical protein
MTEIISTWPWYDRLVIFAVIFALLYAPYSLSKQLSAITQILKDIRDNTRQ